MITLGGDNSEHVPFRTAAREIAYAILDACGVRVEVEDDGPDRPAAPGQTRPADSHVQHHAHAPATEVSRYCSHSRVPARVVVTPDDVYHADGRHALASVPGGGPQRYTCPSKHCSTHSLNPYDQCSRHGGQMLPVTGAPVQEEFAVGKRVCPVPGCLDVPGHMKRRRGCYDDEIRRDSGMCDTHGVPMLMGLCIPAGGHSVQYRM